METKLYEISSPSDEKIKEVADYLNNECQKFMEDDTIV